MMPGKKSIQKRGGKTMIIDAPRSRQTRKSIIFQEGHTASIFCKVFKSHSRSIDKAPIGYYNKMVEWGASPT